MITDARIRTLARQDGVTAGLAEKNYVNSWVLNALFTHPVGDALVFKGGTALSKLYFPEIWRFSEDLDFTATGPIPALQDKLVAALDEIEPESGIGFTLRSFHPAGDPIEYVQVKIQYDAVLGQLNTTKLDITFDEPIVFPKEEHEHAFEDVPSFELTAYSVEEIFVEKLRSLFQRARARDYYDLYRLLEQETFDDGDVADALQRKSEARDMEIDVSEGLAERDDADVEAYWETGLDRLVTELPPFEDVVSRIDSYLRRLAEEFS